MSAADPATAIRAALDAITTPRTGKGLVSSGMIDGLTIEPDGTPVFTFLLRREDPATLVRQARQALAALGVPTPRITVTDPEGPTRPTHPPPQSAQAGVPAPTPMAVPGIARVIAISSGKGGVGKSTVSVNTAIALHRAGLRVGLMDADFYGPNIPRMMGVYERPGVDAEKRIVPLEAHGVKLMSIGFLVDRDAPAIWRGPIITKVLQQFLHDVAWGELDVLLVDMPPGTGDAQLSLVQQVMVSGAVIVTTPQEVAVGDALRGAKMFDRVNVPVLGVVENMGFHACAQCGHQEDVFGVDGARDAAQEWGVPFLTALPLDRRMRVAGDVGRPVLSEEPRPGDVLADADLGKRNFLPHAPANAAGGRVKLAGGALLIGRHRVESRGRERPGHVGLFTSHGRIFPAEFFERIGPGARELLGIGGGHLRIVAKRNVQAVEIVVGAGHCVLAEQENELALRFGNGAISRTAMSKLLGRNLDDARAGFLEQGRAPVP